MTLWAVARPPGPATYGGRVTADEPQYLLSATSLGEDVDLDIADEIAAERYRTFHARTCHRRPGVVGFAAERELPPPVRPDRRRHCQRSVHQIQGTALLHMQFDEYPDAIDQVRVLAEVLRVTPDAGERLGQSDSVDVT